MCAESVKQKEMLVGEIGARESLIGRYKLQAKHHKIVLQGVCVCVVYVCTNPLSVSLISSETLFYLHTYTPTPNSTRAYAHTHMHTPAQTRVSRASSTLASSSRSGELQRYVSESAGHPHFSLFHRLCASLQICVCFGVAFIGATKCCAPLPGSEGIGC